MENPVVHFEIIGTDGRSLLQFYIDLFGWQGGWMDEMSYAPVDTMAGGGINGGIGTAQQGSAPRTTIYVAVPDLQATLDQVEQAGGATVMPVTEIPNVVTLAMFTDPQNNLVGLVQDSEQAPQGPSAGDGRPVTWFELLSAEPSKAREFYSTVFGWEIHGSENSGGQFEYYEVHAPGGKGSGGGIGSSPDGQPHTNIYAQVDDVQKYLEQAESLGGKTVMPVTTMGANLTFALFADPQGNNFGLYNYAQ